MGVVKHVFVAFSLGVRNYRAIIWFTVKCVFVAFAVGVHNYRAIIRACVSLTSGDAPMANWSKVLPLTAC